MSINVSMHQHTLVNFGTKKTKLLHDYGLQNHATCVDTKMHPLRMVALGFQHSKFVSLHSRLLKATIITTILGNVIAGDTVRVH